MPEDNDPFRCLQASADETGEEGALMDDLLFEFTEWLRGTPLNNLALDISESRATMWIGEHFWAIPIFQVIHILAISASFAAVLMMNLRVFGLAGHATLAETSARYAKILWWALAFLVLSGMLMIVGEPIRELVNPYFWIKMVLIVVGVIVAVTFAKALGRQAEAVGGGVRSAGLLLVVLWLMIMWCGRWIAYAPV
jgi:magnesium-transporting ATPase (P-type)